MSHPIRSLIINDVSFSYPEAIEALFNQVNIAFYTGWTGIVGSNGSGKSTLLHLISGILQNDTGNIQIPGPIQVVEQRTDNPPSHLLHLAEGRHDQIWVWRSRLGIQADWFQRWHTLSHGERKRLQIAVALSQEPDVLILDEPDNHLDMVSRDILLTALQDYHGVGLIVSHDRHLLDTLCSHTLFLGRSQPDMRTGGYTAAKQERDREQLAYQRQRDTLCREEKKLRKELRSRSEEQDRTAGKRSRRHLASGDRDGKARVGLAIYSGKDKKAGRLKQVMADRVAGVQEKLSSIQVPKQYNSGIQLEGKDSRYPLLIDETAGRFPATDALTISWPDLQLEFGQRIALTGPNGSGKTLLLKYLLERNRLPRSEILYMPQEIPLAEGSRLISALDDLNPQEKGHALTLVSHLGSDPEGLLQGQVISPGESRKLLLALGMSRKCSLLVLDEPTNHLDILAVTSLEKALLEWSGGILLVSHDRELVGNLAETVWNLERESTGSSRIQIDHT